MMATQSSRPFHRRGRLERGLHLDRLAALVRPASRLEDLDEVGRLLPRGPMRPALDDRASQVEYATAPLGARIRLAKVGDRSHFAVARGVRRRRVEALPTIDGQGP